ncbi:hypothetical protein SAMN04490220_5506 [Rhodococcus jostii]|uniref:Uncharacterized protein n=1 Tax=Rhodococcus jostii TaxID=132919 RepID=A0A1H5DF61_RHOJO|nr:hypothetical protein SAMN04490220_5506 [Rhodococcus jostii]
MKVLLFVGAGVLVAVGLTKLLRGNEVWHEVTGP